MKITANLERREVEIMPTLPSENPFRSSLRRRHSQIPDSLEPARGTRGIEPPGDGDGEVSPAPAMRTIHDLAAKIAQVDLPVLLVGETDAGKAILAGLIHDLSPRRAGPFQVLRCANLGEEELEGELFGRTGDANSGLRCWHPGRLRTCSGGTLVLAEITALPWRLQARLVDVLDNHRVLAVGDHAHEPLDLRILATTRDDPAEAVARGMLRRDLYYRLNCLTLRLPPLRDRNEDAGALTQHWITPNSSAWPKPAPVARGAFQQECLRYTRARKPRAPTPLEGMSA